MKKISAILLLAAVALVGCKEKETVQTVDWYKENTAERAAMIAKCNNNPGELEASPNCVNAQQANNEKASARRGWLKPEMPDLGKRK